MSGMGMPFLTAHWANLFLATYPVPPELLQPRVPPGCELELRDGLALCSLVAFEFKDTRVFGIPWPGYRDFPELNLRFYVRRGEERGVVFVREFVPLRLVAKMARWLYNEPYVYAPLEGAITDNASHITAEYALHFGGREHVLRATGSRPSFVPACDSFDHALKEHRWGYGITRQGVPLRYEVIHPTWDIYPVQMYHIDVDWGLLYGPEWKFLNTASPCSTILAVGSAVAVQPLGRLAAVTSFAAIPASAALPAGGG